MQPRRDTVLKQMPSLELKGHTIAARSCEPDGLPKSNQFTRPRHTPSCRCAKTLFMLAEKVFTRRAPSRNDNSNGMGVRVCKIQASIGTPIIRQTSTWKSVWLITLRGLLRRYGPASFHFQLPQKILSKLRLWTSSISTQRRAFQKLTPRKAKRRIEHHNGWEFIVHKAGNKVLMISNQDQGCPRVTRPNVKAVPTFLQSQTQQQALAFTTTRPCRFPCSETARLLISLHGRYPLLRPQLHLVASNSAFALSMLDQISSRILSPINEEPDLIKTSYAKLSRDVLEAIHRTPLASTKPQPRRLGYYRINPKPLLPGQGSRKRQVCTSDGVYEGITRTLSFGHIARTSRASQRDVPISSKNDLLFFAGKPKCSGTTYISHKLKETVGASKFRAVIVFPRPNSHTLDGHSKLERVCQSIPSQIPACIRWVGLRYEYRFPQVPIAIKQEGTVPTSGSWQDTQLGEPRSRSPRSFKPLCAVQTCHVWQHRVKRRLRRISTMQWFMTRLSGTAKPTLNSSVEISNDTIQSIQTRLHWDTPISILYPEPTPFHTRARAPYVLRGMAPPHHQMHLLPPLSLIHLAHRDQFDFLPCLIYQHLARNTYRDAAARPHHRIMVSHTNQHFSPADASHRLFSEDSRYLPNVLGSSNSYSFKLPLHVTQAGYLRDQALQADTSWGISRVP